MGRFKAGWLLAVCLLVCAGAAPAAVIVKQNNTTNLNVGASWVGGAVPGPNDVAAWTNTVTGPNAVLLGANMNIQGLMVTLPGGEVAIGGDNTLTWASAA